MERLTLTREERQELHRPWPLEDRSAQALENEESYQSILDNLTLVERGLRPSFFLDQHVWYGWQTLKRLRQDLERRRLRATPLKNRAPHSLFVCLKNDIAPEHATDASFARTLHLYAQWLVRNGWMDRESIALQNMDRWDFSADWRLTHLLEHYSQATPHALLIDKYGASADAPSTAELGARLGYLQPHFYNVPRDKLGPCVAILFCSRALTEESCTYNDRRCIQGEFVYGTRDEVNALRDVYEARVETWRRVLAHPVRVGCTIYDRNTQRFEGVYGSASARHNIESLLLRLIAQEADEEEDDEEEDDEEEDDEEDDEDEVDSV